MSSLTATHAPKGLEGIVATNSSICYIDGEQGVLAYRGIDIHELADHSNFEETCYLLWYGKLPTQNELKEFRRQLAAERKLDPAIIDLVRTAPRQTQPMDVLRTAVSALSFYDPEDKKNDHDANLHKAFRLTSQIAMIVAAYDRVRKGKKVVEPDPSLSHAANFLLLLNGTKPSETAERALDIALILHADHELNASTFAARVVAATLVGYAFGGDRGHRRTERAFARRRQRGRLPHSAGHRQGESRPRRLRQGHAGAEEESSRLRPSRVSHRRSAGHALAQDVRATWARAAARASGLRCRTRSKNL